MSSRSSSGTFSSTRLNFAVFAAGCAAFVNMYCTMAILPLFARTFAVSAAHAGLTITIPLLATAIMAPIIGAISDRYGRKTLIVTAAFLLVIPTALAAGAASFGSLIAWRFTQGLMLPFIFTVTVAYIGDETAGPTTAKLSATYLSGAIFGGFAGRFIPGVTAQIFGWRVALLIIAAITLAMAVTIAFCLPRERNFRPVRGIGKALTAFATHARTPKLLATFGVGFGVLFCLVAVFTYINFRLAAAPYHLGPAALGSIFVVYLGAVVATPFGARLANRYGNRRVMLAATPAMLTGLLCTLATPLPVIVFGLLITCCAIFVQQTLATTMVGTAATHAKSAAVGLYVTCYYIGGSTGGILPAPFYHAYHWPGCIAVIAAIQLLMLTLAMRFWRTHSSQL